MFICNNGFNQIFEKRTVEKNRTNELNASMYRTLLRNINNTFIKKLKIVPSRKISHDICEYIV